MVQHEILSIPPPSVRRGAAPAPALTHVLASLFDAVDFALFSVDRDCRYTSFNAHHAALMRTLYGVEIAVGANLFSASTSEESRLRGRANIERAFAGETFTVVGRRGPSGGPQRDYEILYAPVQGADGSVTGVAVLAKDVTARLRRVADLAESEATWRELMEASPEGHILLDRHGHVLACNDVVVLAFGCERHQLLGRCLYDFIPPDIGRRARERVERVCATGEPLTASDPWQDRISETQMRPVKDASGFVTRVSLQSRDITERSKMEEAARAQEHRLRAVHDLWRRDFKTEDELIAHSIAAAVELSASAVGYFHFYDEATETLTLNRWSSSVAPPCRVGEPGASYPLSAAAFTAGPTGKPGPPAGLTAGPTGKPGPPAGLTAGPTGKPGPPAGIWQECVRTRGPVVHNQEAEPGGWGAPNRGPCAISRHMTVPIQDRGRIVGIAGVANKATPYDDSDCEQVQFLMDAMWRMIQRARNELRLLQLSRAVEQSPASIVITDREGRIEYVNPKFCDVTGYRADEALGQNPRVLKSGETPAATYAELWRTIDAGEVWRGELQNRKKSGELYWEACSISPITDSDGRVSHYLAVKEDITNLKAAQAAAQARQATLLAITESSQDGIIMLDHRGDVTFWNAAATRTLGYDASEALGRNLHELVVPSHLLQAHRRALPEFLSSGRGNAVGKTLDVTARRKDGVEIPVSVSLSSVQLDGRWHAIGIVRDITEQKRAERRLGRITECFLQFGRDSRGNVERMLETTVELLEARAAAYLGADGNLMLADHPVSKLIEAAPLAECAALRAMLMGYHSERRSLRPPARGLSSCCGLERCPYCGSAECIVQPVRYGVDQNGVLAVFFRSRVEPSDEDAKVLEIVSVAIGIEQDRIRAEEEKKATTQQLMQAGKLESVGRLAAGIAHEINTPTQFVGDNLFFLGDALGTLIASLKSYRDAAQCAVEGDGLAAVKEAASRVDGAEIDYLIAEIPSSIAQAREGIDRVARIVRAMKDFSHPGSAEKVAVDLNRAIETTITVARNEWKYVADVSLELDPDLPAVPCLAGEINQVLLNLVVNAAHAIGEKVGGTDEKGHIVVTTQSDGASAEIRIHDSGTGVRPEHRARLFDPFFTTKEVGKGTGQGLAIAYNVVVKQHGGTIHCESEPGAGATFVVRLPLRLQPTNSGAPHT